MAGIRGVIFDIDGVLVRGRQLMPGAAETLAILRERGLSVVFCTNENLRTVADTAEKLNGLGLPVDPADVVTAGLVTAEVVAAEYPGRRVLAIGGPGVLEPLLERGVDLVTPAEAAAAEVVVMGRDPRFDHSLLQAACQAIWAGARFLATNYDPRIPVENGYVVGTGAMVKAVAYATGVEPRIMAKPSLSAAATCLRKLGLPAEAVVLVGDQYRQDIGMGRGAGTRTVLVLTGATRAEDLPQIPADLQPDAVLPDVGHLPAWLDAAIVV